MDLVSYLSSFYHLILDPKLTYAEKERIKEGKGLKGRRREGKCEREGGRRREGKKGLSVKKNTAYNDIRKAEAESSIAN